MTMVSPTEVRSVITNPAPSERRFATTVLIVFVAGFLAPRLAHRRDQRTVGMIGLFIEVQA